jgi:spermidine synthase
MKPLSVTKWKAIFLCAIFLSGVSSIIYQLAWVRYLHLVFGNSVYAIAIVLSCFMLGLALGSKFIGKIADRHQDSTRIFISLEIWIGVYGMLSPFIYVWISQGYMGIVQWMEAGYEVKMAVRVAAALLFLVIPTFLMGGTFPVAVKSFSRYLNNIGKDVGIIYSVNTLGAAMGAFGTGFFLLQLAGLRNSIWIAAALNGVVALLIAVARHRMNGRTIAVIGTSVDQGQRRNVVVPDSKPGQSKSFQAIIGFAFALSGFASLSYEVFWTRILSYFFRDTIYDFALVLTAFLTGILLGSLLCARWLHKVRRTVSVFGYLQVLIGIFSLVSLYVIGNLPYIAGHLQTMTSLYAKYGDHYWTAAVYIKFGYAFMIMLIPTTLFGATYPLIGKILIHDLRQLGDRIGLFNSLNTIGAAFGSLLSGFLFLSLFGLQNSIIVMALLNCGIGLALLWYDSPDRRRAAWRACLPVVLTVCLVLQAIPGWDKLRMTVSFLAPNQNLEGVVRQLYYKEDASGLTSVVEVIPIQQKFMTTNRLYAQNSSDSGGMEDHRRLGHIPMLLHPDPESVLVVGLGAGITLRGVGEHPVQDIDCVEISNHVKEAARWFANENNHILDDSRVRVHIDDGRNFIRTSNEKYDVIIGDIYFPMSSGSSNMFSTNYFREVREHLQPEGLFAQWLPMHQLSLSDMQIIIKSFKQEFANTTLWFGLIGDSVPVIGMVGTLEPLTVDWSSLEERIRTLNSDGRLEEIGLADSSSLLSLFVLGGSSLDQFVRGQPVNTDDRPIIEFTAPRIYMNSRQVGLENMAEFSKRVENAKPYIVNIPQSGVLVK